VSLLVVRFGFYAPGKESADAFDSIEKGVLRVGDGTKLDP